MARLDGELLGELFDAATRVVSGGVGRWVSETAVDDRFGLGPPRKPAKRVGPYQTRDVRARSQVRGTVLGLALRGGDP